MQLDPGNVSHCLMRSPYRYKLDHRLRITSLPSLVKGSGKQSSFSSQLGVRPSYRGKEWSVSNENFKFKIRKNPSVNCTERSGIVRMCLLRDSSQAQGWKVKLDNLPPCESSFRLFFHSFLLWGVVCLWSAICFKIMTRYTCGYFPRILAIIPATRYTCVFLPRILAFFPALWGFYSQVYDHFLTNAHIYAHKKAHIYALQTSMWYMGSQKVVV